MLDSVVKSATRNVRPKYALLNGVDKKTQQRLEDYDIKLIDLNVDGESFDEKVCDFLYRLWEHNNYYGTHTKIKDIALATAEERLAHAITLRQNNQLDKAATHLNTLYKDIGKLPFNQLSSLLWVIVSVEDKREEWSFMEITNDRYIEPYLEEIKNKTNAKIANSFKAVYYSALALAFCRAGDYKKALIYLKKTGNWRCTNTADRNHQIVTANLLTEHALVLLHRSTEQVNKKQSLLEARRKLEEAWLLFKDYGQLDRNDESHHLGRFYGTQVFVSIACDEARLEVDIALLSDCAKRAHNDGRNRTSFGQVVGLYCEAVYHYWLAKRTGDDKEINQYISKAKTLLTEARKDVDEKQKVVLLKFELLEVQLSMMSGDRTEQTSKLISEDRLSCLPELLREKVKNKPEEWLFLPLN